MTSKVFENKSILITGGTGSLGKVLVRHLLEGRSGHPNKIRIISRDEAKQHYMRVEYQHASNPTDEIIYDNFKKLLEFRIGDVRDYGSVVSCLDGVDIVINAAALKQVPTCEYFPVEATLTNIMGAHNLVRAIREHRFPVETAVGVTTDKACKPINAMGMTKALQERVFIAANIDSRETRYICVRYGNVLASRGSVIPLFHHQIRNVGTVTITTDDMTRFLLPLEHAVVTIATAVAQASPGETFIPKIPAAKVIHIAKALIGERDTAITTIGIRPGEKIHEEMISEEEGFRAYNRGDFYAIKPMLPEIASLEEGAPLGRAYSSNDDLMDLETTRALLEKHGLLVEQVDSFGADGELLR